MTTHPKAEKVEVVDEGKVLELVIGNEGIEGADWLSRDAIVKANPKVGGHRNGDENERDDAEDSGECIDEVCHGDGGGWLSRRVRGDTERGRRRRSGGKRRACGRVWMQAEWTRQGGGALWTVGEKTRKCVDADNGRGRVGGVIGDEGNGCMLNAQV